MVGEAISLAPPTSSSNSSSSKLNLNRIRLATYSAHRNLQQPCKQGRICLVVGSAKPNPPRPNLPQVPACSAGLPSGNSLKPSKQATRLVEVGCSVV